MNHITIASLIASDIETHGHAYAAKRYAKKMPFTIFHFLAFGYLPRATLTRVVVQVEGTHYPIKVAGMRAVKECHLPLAPGDHGWYDTSRPAWMG